MKKREILTASRQAIYKVEYAVPVTVDSVASTGYELIDQRKIVKEGTVVDFTKQLLESNQAKVTALTTSKSGKGILLADVDITDGDAIGTALVKGIVFAERITNFTISDFTDVLGNGLIQAVSTER